MTAAPSTAITLTGSDQQAWAGPGTYRGVVVRETAGSAASVRVHDGTSAAGPLVAVVDLVADASADLDHAVGRRCADGLFVDVTGSVAGSIFIA